MTTILARGYRVPHPNQRAATEPRPRMSCPEPAPHGPPSVADDDAIAALATDRASWLAVRIARALRARHRRLVDPEDVLQETLLVLWRYAKQRDQRDKVLDHKWIAATADNRLRRIWRRAVTAEAGETDGGAASVERHCVDMQTPFSIVAEVDSENVIQRALDRLRGIERTVVALHVFEGVPLTRVARDLGCSRKATRVALASACARLAQHSSTWNGRHHEVGR